MHPSTYRITVVRVVSSPRIQETTSHETKTGCSFAFAILIIEEASGLLSAELLCGCLFSRMLLRSCSALVFHKDNKNLWNFFGLSLVCVGSK